MSRLRCQALASWRTTGRELVGATFQLGGKFGVGRSGGIEKTSLICAYTGTHDPDPLGAADLRRGDHGTAIHEIVTPLSTGYTCPVSIRDSSDARNTAMLGDVLGLDQPNRCAAASFFTRGLPASSRPRTRSVIVADGAIALTRTLCGANSTAIERVIAAMPPFAARQSYCPRLTRYRNTLRVSAEVGEGCRRWRGTGSSSPSPSSRQSAFHPDPAAAGRKTRGSARVCVAAVVRDTQYWSKLRKPALLSLSGDIPVPQCH